MSQQTLIDYWSYSSMTQLMRNPLAFKKKYILKIYDDISSPSSVVGKAAHTALEAYYNGREQHEAIEVGMDYINNLSDTGIDYGKTGSRANIIATYTQAINFYFAEMPDYHELLGVELGITSEITDLMGATLGLPAKGFLDIVARNKLGEIEITDHKFVRNYTAGDVDDFSHFVQAMFCYHLVKAHFGEAPARIIFNECKVSKNKDGSDQIQPYTIEFNNNADFATFYKLYNDCTEFIENPNVIFLPNPNDIFDGQNTFEVYRSGVIGVDRPTEVEHKTAQVAFTEKNFVPSAFDKVEAKDFSAEERIRIKFAEFGVTMQMDETHVGPSITKYTMKPNRGVPMSKIARMASDISIALGAENVRIEAPIKGTSFVGVEVPNAVRTTVELAEQHFKPGTMDIPIGVDVYGNTVHKSLTDMPHLLIAGATGSGKSVMLNVLLRSLIRQNDASKMKLVLIDPKQVELTQFSGEPHLMMPVVTTALGAVETLADMVVEMEKRYKRLARAGVRSIDDFKSSMPKIVVVVDEFADLMMSDIKPSVESMDIKAFNENLLYAIEDGNGKLTQKATIAALKRTIEQNAPPSAEQSIIRIAQKARAVGIHLVLATQRPSADVVTGLIKANIPTKIAFMTTSAVNSRIILDTEGAEKLTGKGDMLFLDTSKSGLQRLQGLYC